LAAPIYWQENPTSAEFTSATTEHFGALQPLSTAISAGDMIRLNKWNSLLGFG